MHYHACSGARLGITLRHNTDKDGYGSVVLLPQFAFALRTMVGAPVPVGTCIKNTFATSGCLSVSKDESGKGVLLVAFV